MKHDFNSQPKGFMGKVPSDSPPAKKKGFIFLAFQNTISSVSLAMLMMSCMSYRTTTAPLIASENTIKVIMKSGDVIEPLKVTSIDSVKIVGVQSMDLDGGGRVDYNRVILMSDIQSIKKQEYSSTKTQLLVGVMVLVPLWFIISNSANPPAHDFTNYPDFVFVYSW